MDRGRPAVFLDTDGTLLPNLPHNCDVDLIELTPGALSAALQLHQAGFALVIVTNQPGVARGLCTEDDVARVEAHLREMLDPAGVPLAGFYFCPHDPRGTVDGYALDCCCRKPQPGMLLRAAYELDLDLTRSWMVGDGSDDVEAGRRARITTVLLNPRNETEWLLSPDSRADYVATSMREVARTIRGASSYWPAAAASARPKVA